MSPAASFPHLEIHLLRRSKQVVTVCSLRGEGNRSRRGPQQRFDWEEADPPASPWPPGTQSNQKKNIRYAFRMNGLYFSQSWTKRWCPDVFQESSGRLDRPATMKLPHRWPGVSRRATRKGNSSGPWQRLYNWFTSALTSVSQHHCSRSHKYWWAPGGKLWFILDLWKCGFSV